MHAHKIILLPKGVEYEEQVNDHVFKYIQFAYVTYIADNNGVYDPKDQTKVRSTAGVAYLDEIGPNSFTPHSDVTYDMLVNWVKAKIDETQLQNKNIAAFDE